MRKTILMLAGASLLLAGCTLQRLSAVCAREIEARAALDVSEAKAMAIADGVKREAALGAIRTARAALDKCPAAAGAPVTLP